MLLSKYWQPNIIDPNRPEQEINDDLSFLLVRISSLMQFLESNLANLESGLPFKRKSSRYEPRSTFTLERPFPSNL